MKRALRRILKKMRLKMSDQQPNHTVDRGIYIVYIDGDTPHLCWNGREWAAKTLSLVITWPSGPTTTFQELKSPPGGVFIFSVEMSNEASIVQVLMHTSKVAEEVEFGNRLERARAISAAPPVNQQDVPVRVPEWEAECPPE